MAYLPAHNYAVFWAEEENPVTESTNGITPPTVGDAPTTLALLGYLPSTPELDRGLNNAQGFSIGSPNSVYGKRGARNPKLSFKIRVADIAFLQMATRVDGALPELYLSLVVPGVRTVECRYCKIEQVTLTTSETPTGEGGEIEVDVQIEALVVNEIAYESPGSGDAPDADIDALTVALKDPLYWHDVRTVTLTDSANTTVDYRNSIMSFSATIKHNLERKGVRPNFGDHVATSNTNLALLEHQQNISGELKLHGYLPAALFNATKTAMDWGNTVIVIADTPITSSSTDRVYTLTLGSCTPQNVTEAGTEANGQLSSTVPFFAKTWTLASS